MYYSEFRKQFSHYPLILSQDMATLKEDRQVMRNQFNRWAAKGLLIKLKRGAYILNDSDRKIAPSRDFVANQLYSPSYVSLEDALNFYGLIPERVTDVTSVTTRKTLRINNRLGSFIYQHIKPSVFRGFKALKDEAGVSFFIAEPEKAVMDFLYLNLHKFQKDYAGALRESYRFQNLEGVRTKRIMEFAQLFNNLKLMKVAKAFCQLVKNGASL